MNVGTRRSPRGLGSVVVLVAGLCLGGATLPTRATAQTSEIGAAIGGTAAGIAGGFYLTTAIYVAKARFGSFIYSMYDVARFRAETIPVFALPVAGGVLGATSPGRLKDALIWGGVGLVGGAALGAGLGRWVWGGSEGTWAGGIVGSAAGMLAGSVIGALSGGDTEDEPAGNRFFVSVPLGVRLF